MNRVLAEARIAIVITRSSGRESAPISSGESRESQSRLTSAATVIVPPEEVREKFRHIKPLKDIPIQMRGWTLDVLNIVRRLVDSRRRGNESGSATGKGASLLTSAPTGEFTTADAYAFEGELEKLHPDNRHVRDKIRQQLQVGFLFARICVCRLMQMPDAKRLRDARLLLHVGRGEWRLP
ncbi:MAG: hypothetical protein WAO02_11405 [Verrucomicrobiia bacterium]